MSGLWSGSGPSHSMQRMDRGPLQPGGSARLIGLKAVCLFRDLALIVAVDSNRATATGC
jgi:hypothetical protein